MNSAKKKKDALQDKSLALVISKENKSGEEEVMLYKGMIKIEDEVIFFEQDSDKIKFILIDDWILKIMETPGDLSDVVFEAEYMITLNIGEGPDDVSQDQFDKTGLKWES